ncbi:putative Sec14 cytosolic factor [Ixodes scapularis]
MIKCPLDEEFLVKFLRGRKYRVEEAFEIIRKYFRVRLEYTDIFDNLLPSRIMFDAIFRQHKLLTLLKKPDPQGRRITLFKLGVWNPGVCSLNEFFRAVIVGAEYCLLDQRFQIAGVVAVVDLEGLNFSHLLHYTPKELRKTVKLGQECYPLRIKGIYLVNNPEVFQLIYAVVKLFLNAKIIKRVHFIGRDYNQLHKLVPRELLPEEYGGTLDNYDYDEFERALLSTDTFLWSSANMATGRGKRRKSRLDSKRCPLDEEFLVKFLRGRKYRVEEAFEIIRKYFRRFQIAGVVAVVDLEGLNFSHLLHYTPKELRKTVKLGQECYPLRIKGIYLVNNPEVFQLMYAVVKLFLNAKIIKRVHFIGRDYDQLHKFVPRELLPEEYGGTLDNYDYDEFERALLSTDTFFVELGKHGYREQKAQKESTGL